MINKQKVYDLKLSGIRQQEIAKIFGVSRQRISQIFFEIEEKLTGKKHIPKKIDRNRFKETGFLTDMPARIRKFVFKRDGNVCVYCGKKSYCADHIIPKCQNGTHGSDNLVSSCNSCNSSKGNKSLKEWKNMSVSKYKKEILERTKDYIFELYKNGESLREIAYKAGKSHTWVWQIVREKERKNDKT